MAEISHSGLVNTRQGRLEVTWEQINNDDTFEAVDLSEVFGAPFIVSLQITGTPDSASVALHGSLDGTNYAALGDIAGTDIALTTDKELAETGEAAVYYKPVATGGGGSQDLDATLVIWVV